MSFDGNVLPGILAALKSLTGGPSSGGATVPGQLMSVHLGEQWKVTGRGPVAWVLGSAMTEPEPGGSDLEKTNWQVEVRILHQFAPDQRHSEEVLAALIEPLRDVFRKHRKLSWSQATSPTGGPINFPPEDMTQCTITRARVSAVRWQYILVDGVMYRMLAVTVLVGEKIGVRFQTGT